MSEILVSVCMAASHNLSCTCSIILHHCELAVGGFYNSLLLQAIWFDMALNVVDALYEPADSGGGGGGGVGR